MKTSFYIPKDKLEETKKAIRRQPSLRFIHNPYPIGEQYYISLSGDVLDFNLFNREKEEILNLTKRDKKSSLLKRIVTFLFS